MFCPQCGKANSVEQNFCRSCGLSLEKVAQSLAEQLPVTQPNKDLEDRKHQVERWLAILLGSTVGFIVIAALCAVLYKVVIVKGNVLAGLVFLAVFLAAVAAMVLVVYRESLNKALNKRELPQTTLPLTGMTAKLLPESNIEPLPSVTEGTTELLFAEKKGHAEGG